MGMFNKRRLQVGRHDGVQMNDFAGDFVEIRNKFSLKVTSWPEIWMVSDSDGQFSWTGLSENIWPWPG